MNNMQYISPVYTLTQIMNLPILRQHSLQYKSSFFFLASSLPLSWDIASFLPTFCSSTSLLVHLSLCPFPPPLSLTAAYSSWPSTSAFPWLLILLPLPAFSSSVILTPLSSSLIPLYHLLSSSTWLKLNPSKSFNDKTCNHFPTLKSSL